MLRPCLFDFGLIRNPDVIYRVVQHTKKKRIITKALNTENTKGKSSDGLMNG